VTTSGVFNRHDFRQPLATLAAAIAETDFLHDHQRPQASLCEIISRPNTSVVDEHQPAIHVLDDATLQRHGFFVLEFQSLQQ